MGTSYNSLMQYQQAEMVQQYQAIDTDKKLLHDTNVHMIDN